MSSFPLSSSLLSVILFLHLFISRAVIKLPNNESIPAVIVFGDSVVDTGNNNYIETIAKVNFPPYGKDFHGGIPTGRFCNGKVPSDLFVEELGIKELLPAYLDPNLQSEELITGVNFASGGAGYDPLTSELAPAISLSEQLKLFEEYRVKLERLVGEETSTTILSKTLFVLVFGSNDITNTYFNTPLRRPYYDVPSYANLLLNFASSFLQELYKSGARRIGVLGIPPTGCVPAMRTLEGGLQRKCVEEFNYAVQLFNNRLLDELNLLNSKLSQARIVYLDIYNLPLDLINNPEKYGFEISDKGCCGTGAIEVAFLCKFSCENVSEYVFWDSFHLTEKAYRLLVHRILQEHINSFVCQSSRC